MPPFTFVARLSEQQYVEATCHIDEHDAIIIDSVILQPNNIPLPPDTLTISLSLATIRHALHDSPHANLGRTVPSGDHVDELIMQGRYAEAEKLNFEIHKVDQPVQLTEDDLAFDVTIINNRITSLSRRPPGVIPNGIYHMTAKQSQTPLSEAHVELARLERLLAQLGDRRDYDGVTEVENQLEQVKRKLISSNLQQSMSRSPQREPTDAELEAMSADEILAYSAQRAERRNLSTDANWHVCFDPNCPPDA